MVDISYINTPPQTTNTFTPYHLPTLSLYLLITKCLVYNLTHI